MSVPESGYVELTATCTTAGSIGNVKAGEINRFPVTLPGLTAVENITDFTGGYDAESDADLLERYLEKVSRPNVAETSITISNGQKRLLVSVMCVLFLSGTEPERLKWSL